MEKLNGVGKCKTKIISKLAEDGLSGGVGIAKSCCQKSGFSAVTSADQLRKLAGRLGSNRLPDSPINRPARTPFLDGRSRLIEPQVTDLGLTGAGAVIKLPINDQPAADTAAEVDPKHRVVPATSPVQCFAKRGDIGVIVDIDVQPSQISEPAAKFEIVPPVDLVGTTDLACAPINWPAEADADGRGIVLSDHFGKASSQFSANAFRSGLAVHRKPSTIDDLTRRCSSYDLELRPSNLDPNQHGDNVTQRAVE
jgi:hypothetical protein